MGKSSIEWTEQTWNPARGCTRISPGCVNCYAERMAARDLPGLKSPTGEPFAIITPSGPRWTGKVELIPHMLDVPLKRNKPTTWFVNSMSDLFHEELSNEDIRRVFQVIRECRGRHTFQILTKRAARLPEWFAWAKTVEPGWFNAAGILDLWQVWIGVSVEDQQRADERIPHLLATPAAVRWVSYEPALGPVDFEGYLGGDWACDCGWRGNCTVDHCGNCGFHGEALTESNESGDWAVCPDCKDADAMEEGCPRCELTCYVCAGNEGEPARLDWIVIGGESGPGARPFFVDWARDVIASCKSASVPVFMKQAGRYPNGSGFPEGFEYRKRDRKGGDPEEWPANLRVREFPEVKHV